MSNRGERKDDKEPEDFQGTGVVERIAEFIMGSGLAKRAEEALKGRGKKIDDAVEKRNK
jgi:hypothetical protein